MATTVKCRSISRVMPPPRRATQLGIIALVLAATAVVAGAQCEYAHTYLGNSPKEKEPGWHRDAQGLDHDGV
jgi:hypothetical protein